MAKEMGARMKDAMREGARGADRDYRDDRDAGLPPSARGEGGPAYDDSIPSAQEEPAPPRD
jgi:hypothetical protein